MNKCKDKWINVYLYKWPAWETCLETKESQV